MTTPTYLHTKNLSIGYADKILLSHLDLQLNKGEMVCLLGANGVGKSTLIRTILGLTPALDGRVFINEKPLSDLHIKTVAKHISIVLTTGIPPNNFTVYELVALGRTPHTNWLGKLNQTDKARIKDAMQLVAITHFSDRQVNSLSDGERQRVMLAKALVQDTELIILDEPTAHLDVTNRVALLLLLKKLAKETGKGILLSTHELELALQVADSIWLINNKKKMIKGTPNELILSNSISQTFNSGNVNFDNNSRSFKIEGSSL